jgi:cyclopropane fatty-acyl-phospholipid synthase-like methyltransferase
MSSGTIVCFLLLCLSCGGTQGPDTNSHHHQHSSSSQEHGHKEHKDHHHHRFDDAEKWAQRFDDPKRDEWQRPAEVIEYLQLAEGMTVADIGAGTGYFLPGLSQAVGQSGQVLGLDIEKDMVRYMRERAAREGLANVSAEVVPPDDANLQANSVDRILIVNTWHHIGDRVKYTRKLHAALREKGMLVIVDFTMETEKGPPKKHRLHAEAVMAELRQAGMSPELIEETLPDQYIVVATALTPNMP